MSRRICTVLSVAVAALFVNSGASMAQRITRRFAVDTPAAITPRSARGNPATALALGIVVPGAGYLYSGRYSKAPVAFALSLGGVLAGICVYQGQCPPDGADRLPAPSGHHNLGVALVVGGAAAWLWSAFDASRAVERNEPAGEIDVRPPIARPPR